MKLSRLICGALLPHAGKTSEAMREVLIVLVVGLAFLASSCAYMAVSRDNQLILNSRYSEVVQRLEPKATDHSKAKLEDFYWLCQSYMKLKRYNKLFACVDQMQRKIQSGDRTWFFFDLSPVPHTLRAQALIDLGQYSDAIKEARQAYELAGAKVFKFDSLALLGLAYALAGDRENALRTADKLDGISQFWDNLQFNKYGGLAKIHMAVGDFAKSLEEIRKAEDKAFQAFTDMISGAALMGESIFVYERLPREFILAKSLYETGQVIEAKQRYDLLLQHSQTRDNGDIYWLILFDRGRIAAAEGDRSGAIDFYRRAIEVIEQQRSTINTETSKIGFVGDKQDVYSGLISTLFAAGRYAGAFEYVERAKARALVDLLAERQRFAPKERDPGEILEMLAQLASLEAETRVLDASMTANQLAGRRRSVTEARQNIVSRAPELASLVTVSALSAADIQGLIGDDEALVDYFYQAGELFAFVVTRGAVRGVKLDSGDLSDTVAVFRDALAEYKSDSYRPVAREMYDRLIAPLAEMLGRPKLTIVPHGVLHYLPFNALHTGEEFLIDRYAIRLLPSASVLKYLKGWDRPLAQEILVLGNPDLGDPKWDLKGTEAEALEIGRTWSGSTVLLRKNASETVVKKAGGHFRYLHIASHGKFHSDRPLDSGILLAADGENDGRLTVSELYDLELNADLVTLSACETGLGEVRNGDDIVGLTRGFLYAGARAIVASLWPVSDDATRDLMTRFYAKLQSVGKREGLRQAQIETRKKYPHPYFWAAFQITGSGR